MLLVSALIVGCAAPQIASVPDGTFDSNGVKIRYFTAGEGETVVLIHGWMSDSSSWGRDASGNTKLDSSGAEGFQVVALDCRGHGKSGKPHEREKYGAEMAADVVRLLDHLKVKKAHLVGYSMGAFIAGKVAATHPDRVLSVFYGGQAPLLTGEDNGSAEVDAFAKAVDSGKDLGAYLMEFSPPNRPKPTPEIASAYAKFLFKDKDVKALAAAGRSFPDLAVDLGALKKCKAPALFLFGENDISRNRIRSVQKALGYGEIKVVMGADHMTTLIKPDFGASLIGFLRANKTK